MDELKSISELKPQILRQLFSAEQYKQFYEDIVRGYIEFLKPNATRKQILDAHLVKRLKLANVFKHKVSKPYRQYREPFRLLNLIDIYRTLSNQQFAYLANIILIQYCESLCDYLPADLVNTTRTIYYDFLAADIPVEFKEHNPTGRPSRGVTT